MPKLNSGYPQQPVLQDGKYAATLVEVKEYERVYSTGPTTKLAWLFDVEATEENLDPDVVVEADYDPDGPFRVAATTAKATSKNSKFAELNFWAFVGQDWDYETDPLLETRADVRVTSYVDQNGQTKNIIDKVFAPKKGKKAQPKDDIQVTEEDFESIPF